MICDWFKTACMKNKTVFFVMMAMTAYEMTNSLEEYILKRIALVSNRVEEYSKHDPGNYSCPYRLRQVDESDHLGEHTFYWTEQQKAAVQILRSYSPIFTMLAAGSYSDQYGGHRVVLVGLILSGAIMSSCYLSVFKNNFIFLLMLAIRRASQGIVWTAFFSLIGKLTLQGHRTFFVASIFVGEGFGVFLASIVSGSVVKWKATSFISGFVGFFSAMWWCMVCSSTQFPTVSRFIRIPWKSVLTSISLYVICLVNTSSYVFGFIASIVYENYAREVLFFEYDPEWVIYIVFCFTEVFSYLFFGISSDYIISTKLITTSAVRRSGFSLAVVTLFSTLAVVKLVKCNRLMAVTCSVVLHYAYAIASLSAAAAILDFSPSCSGAVTGLVFTFALIVKFLLHSFLLNTFVSGDSKGDINYWSGLFFAAAFIALFFSLPFICIRIKPVSWGVDNSRPKNTRNDANKPEVPQNIELTQSAEEGDKMVPQDTRPGPSKTSS